MKVRLWGKSAARRLRSAAGAIAYDFPRFLAAMRHHRWIEMRNRDEHVVLDGRGVRCEWEFTSDLNIATVFPWTAARLMRAAFAQWPIRMRDVPEHSGTPDVAFVIGHRGTARLRQLLMTLRSIAGQVGTSVEVIVVEQDTEPRIRSAVPDWVKHVFTPCSTDYNRAATLNAGVRAATAPIIVLHDNDMLVPAAYAAECKARIAEGFDFLELKRFTFYLDETTTEHVFVTGEPPEAAPAVVVQNLLGASVVARRENYFQAGGFDEEFVGWGGEDNEFWERAEASGRTYRFGYLPFVHLFHAPQKGKAPNAPAVQRYHDLRGIPVEDRIARLRGRG